MKFQLRYYENEKAVEVKATTHALERFKERYEEAYNEQVGNLPRQFAEMFNGAEKSNKMNKHRMNRRRGPRGKTMWFENGRLAFLE